MKFLTRLRRDVAGNTLAIVAAAMIPLVAMIGSGVDMSRAYMVQSRLQQACDAGVLAGRKEMADGGWNTAAHDAAVDYFEVNFASDYLGTSGVSFTPTNPSGTSNVRGVASVDVPTVIMNFFTIDKLAVAVSCEAKFDVATRTLPSCSTPPVRWHAPATPTIRNAAVIFHTTARSRAAAMGRSPQLHG